MNILFLHRNFPAQFRHVAAHFAADPKNTVIYISEEKRGGIELPGVLHIPAPPERPLAEDQRKRRSAVLDRQVESSERYSSVLLTLRKRGFIPQLIYAHPGWGNSLFVRDIFPEAAYACFCEWYYTKEADYTFFSKGRQKSPVEFAVSRLRNLCQLSALSECDLSITPTLWQKSRYPEQLQAQMHVIHDGIDTDFFHPAPYTRFSLPETDLSVVKELVTYTARGLEPYRGFPQFYRALPRVLEARPDCHVVIMAEDRVCYGPTPKDTTFGKLLRDEVPLDMSRVHFTGFRPYEEYRSLLQASSVHVYLTAPFVLSWSMLEAMSCGALLVASDTEPVREVIRHRENGLLVNFWDSQALADSIVECLVKQDELHGVRQAARQTIEQHYALNNLLPQHIALLNSII